MATASFISNPKMSFKYYYIDNSNAHTMHYSETLEEGIEHARRLGGRIEIYQRFGGMFGAVAVVEENGQVTHPRRASGWGRNVLNN